MLKINEYIECDNHNKYLTEFIKNNQQIECLIYNCSYAGDEITFPNILLSNLKHIYRIENYMNNINDNNFIKNHSKTLKSLYIKNNNDNLLYILAICYKLYRFIRTW